MNLHATWALILTLSGVTSCFGLVATDSYQYLESNGYSSGFHYGNFENQAWTIATEDSNRKVTISIVNIDIEDCYWDCGCDYLAVYDGSSDSDSLLEKYCGTITSGTLTSTDGYMHIKFVTDFSFTRRGFRLMYWQVGDDDKERWLIIGMTFLAVVIILGIFGISFICLCYKKKDQVVPHTAHYISGNVQQGPQLVWTTTPYQFNTFHVQAMGPPPPGESTLYEASPDMEKPPLVGNVVEPDSGTELPEGGTSPTNAVNGSDIPEELTTWMDVTNSHPMSHRTVF